MNLLDALASSNVRAFLAMIRHGEGTSDPDGYRRMFGGKLFDSFDDHPRQVQTAKLGKGGQISSSAAGAYQFLSSTWRNLVKQWGFKDFSPHSQDLGAIALILGRKALDDVIAGRFDEAVAKCAKEWASLPGSPYGQPTTTLEKAREIYQQAGGAFAEVPVGESPNIEEPLVQLEQASYENPDLYVTPTKEPVMAPFLLAALPALFEAAPKLVKAFTDDGTTVPQRNLKALEIAVDAAKQAVGASNEQALAEALKDPQAAAAARQAIDASWAQITDATGIPEARKADAAVTQAEKSFIYSPAFWITLMMMPLVYGVTYMVLAGDFSQETKAMVVSAIITGVLGSVTGFWLGTSFGSSRKTELLASKL